jgi:hypothetical protein
VRSFWRPSEEKPTEGWRTLYKQTLLSPKENDMYVTCRRSGYCEIQMKIFVGKPGGKTTLERPDVNGRIILKLVLE